MCLMCLVNERGEISPILGQGQHSGVNFGPYPFFRFHCHGLVLIFAKKDFAQFQKKN